MAGTATTVSGESTEETIGEGRTYGYIRVSTREQNEDRQRIAMKECGIPESNVY